MRYISVYERAVKVAQERICGGWRPKDEQEREMLLAQIRVGSGCSLRTSQAVLKDVLMVAAKGQQVRL